jgi:V8-like Glu-specific endopeptidase
VVDDDERQAVGEDSALKFIGLIRGKFASNRGVHIGTGAIIGEDLVLTAAHNVCSINSK